MVIVERDAKGSSPMSDAVLPLALAPCGPRNALGGCAADIALGPMISSMIRLRSTALAALRGSTRLLCSLGGGQTASRKMEPVSARMPRRCGTVGPPSALPELGVGDRYRSMGEAESDGPGEPAWKSRERGDRPGAGLSLMMEREWM